MRSLRLALDELRDAGLYRELRTVESAQGPRVRLDGRDVLLLCSNDYLGLAGDPRLRAAAAEAAERWGAGAGASRLISGTMTPHLELERRLAEVKGTEAAVLFGSGYLANTGVISALAGPGEIVVSHARNHASIIDGCRLARAETKVYADLDELAHALDDPRPATVVTDAVFSMDGDVAPLTEIVELARRHGARVVVDEAHATGVIGPEGRGLVHALGLQREVIAIGTLGKALGSYGAFAACDGDTADFLVNRARTFIYSTALPPPSVGAALKALELMDRELVGRLHANARVLREALGAEAGDMPIVPLLAGDPDTALARCAEALDRGVFVQAIRPPTVAPGTSRLRAVATAAHTETELREAARSISTCGAVHG
jgi:8-amino-7-oxononanoate synthase